MLIDNAELLRLLSEGVEIDTRVGHDGSEHLAGADQRYGREMRFLTDFSHENQFFAWKTEFLDSVP